MNQSIVFPVWGVCTVSQLLPGFMGSEGTERPLFSMNAIENSQFLPLTKAAISMHKGRHKLIAYLGYDDMEKDYEMYDLDSDFEEMQNLAEKDTILFSQLKEELLEHLTDANSPFVKDS